MTEDFKPPIRGSEYIERFKRISTWSDKEAVIKTVRESGAEQRRRYAAGPVDTPSKPDLDEFGLVDVFANHDAFDHANLFPEEKSIPKVCPLPLGTRQGRIEKESDVDDEDDENDDGGSEEFTEVDAADATSTISMIMTPTSSIVDEKSFRKHFDLFTEGLLKHVNWNNLFCAGGSVLGTLQPVPTPHNLNNRTKRQYFHDEKYPASDIDLFIWGLTEDEGKAKINEVYEAICEAVPYEVICFRTAYAITLVSQYPFRHVQVVLRLYSNPAEILHGFDVDSCAVGYDGEKVWVLPRTHNALVTRINNIDLTRRSPSYEMRLAKYSTRGFEVAVPSLLRSRVDPTLLERPWGSVNGLAKLLLLEKLQTPEARWSYKQAQRQSRMIPHGRLSGMMRDPRQRERLERTGQDASDYSTVFLPWGPTWTAAKIKKVMIIKDVLLNAPWVNDNDDRGYKLHPCFIGTAQEVVEDQCPNDPPIPEDVDEEEIRHFVRGKLKWVTDDPGRQEIGSFNPVTTDDWEEGAYLTMESEKLCHLANEGNVEEIVTLLDDDTNTANVETRDYLGRAVIHLAVFANHESVVELLLKRSCRITSRLKDGRNLLHIAAQYNTVSIAKMILARNEELKSAEIENGDYEEDYSDEEEENTIEQENEILDIDETNTDDGYTALQYAVFFGRVAIVELLLNAGATFKVKSGSISNILCQLAKFRPDDAATIFNLFIAKGWRLSLMSNFRTGLVDLVCANAVDLIKVAEKVDPDFTEILNQPDDCGKTPLMYAIHECPVETVDLLVSMGAQLESDIKKTEKILELKKIVAQRGRNRYGYFGGMGFGQNANGPLQNALSAAAEYLESTYNTMQGSLQHFYTMVSAGKNVASKVDEEWFRDNLKESVESIRQAEKKLEVVLQASNAAEILNSYPAEEKWPKKNAPESPQQRPPTVGEHIAIILIRMRTSMENTYAKICSETFPKPGDFEANFLPAVKDQSKDREEAGTTDSFAMWMNNYSAEKEKVSEGSFAENILQNLRDLADEKTWRENASKMSGDSSRSSGHANGRELRNFEGISIPGIMKLIITELSTVGTLIFKDVAAMVPKAGAKRFEDLNPNDKREMLVIQDPRLNNSSRGRGGMGLGRRNMQSTQIKGKGGLVRFTKLTDNTSWYHHQQDPYTEEEQMSILKIFEAAWSGDLKILANSIDGFCNTKPKASFLHVTDVFKRTPFVVAVLRGHVDCAKLILTTVNSRYTESANARAKKKLDTQADNKQTMNNFSLADALGSGSTSLASGLQAAVGADESSSSGDEEDDDHVLNLGDPGLAADVELLGREPVQKLLQANDNLVQLRDVLPVKDSAIENAMPKGSPGQPYLKVTPVNLCILRGDAAMLKMILEFCETIVDVEDATKGTDSVGFAHKLLQGANTNQYYYGHTNPTLQPIQLALVLQQFDCVSTMIASCGGGLDFKQIETTDMRKGKNTTYTALGGEEISEFGMMTGSMDEQPSGLKYNMNLAHTAAYFASDESTLNFLLKECTQAFERLVADHPLSVCGALAKEASVKACQECFLGLTHRDSYGRSVLHYAIEVGNLFSLKQLLSQEGVKELVDTDDKSKKTPLMLAVEHQHHEIIKVLLDAGANPLQVEPGTKKTILHKSVSLPSAKDARKMLNILKETLNKELFSCLCEEIDIDGRTACVEAFALLRTDIASEILPSTRAVRDNEGRNRFHFAALKKASEKVKNLLSDPNADEAMQEDANGATPFDLAVQQIMKSGLSGNNRQFGGARRKQVGFGGATAKPSSENGDEFDAYACAELFLNLPGARKQIDFESVQELSKLRSANATSSTKPRDHYSTYHHYGQLYDSNQVAQHLPMQYPGKDVTFEMYAL